MNTTFITKGSEVCRVCDLFPGDFFRETTSYFEAPIYVLVEPNSNQSISAILKNASVRYAVCVSKDHFLSNKLVSIGKDNSVIKLDHSITVKEI